MKFGDFSSPFDEKKLNESVNNLWEEGKKKKDKNFFLEYTEKRKKFLENYATNFLKIANFRKGIQTPAFTNPVFDFYSEQFTIFPELDFLKKLTADEIIAQIYLPNQPLLS
jgi:hypothetical protein